MAELQRNEAELHIAGCSLRINSDLVQESALLLKPSGPVDGHHFFLPIPKSDELRFKPGQDLLLACPGKRNSIVIKGQPETYNKEITAITAFCYSGKTFLIDGEPTNFRSIKCKRTPESLVVNRGDCYMNRYDKYNIGFEVNQWFISLIELCFDPHLHTTLYTKFSIMKEVENSQKNLSRLNHFRKESFFKCLESSIDSVYHRENEQATFKKLLGSAHLAKRYINCNSRRGESLQRGHLAARADFVYYPQQKATQYYINTVPQWQSFNEGNWKTLEGRIRKYAEAHNTNLVVYAGSYKVATLLDKRNKERQLFLALDSEHNKVLPVPQQLYRIVHDQNRNRGIVFLGINSVQEDLNVSRYIICEDVCYQTISFFTEWNGMNVTRGYIYCCTIGDFLISTKLRPVFPEIPINLPLLT